MCVWIPFILLKTENNKKEFLITVHIKNIVHLYVYTVHVSWTVQEALGPTKIRKKKKTKNVDSVKMQTSIQTEL